MAKRVMVVLIATAAALTAPPVLAQPAAGTSTPVAPLTVQGAKRTGPWVPAEDPVPVELRIRGTEFCNVILQDPGTRALVAMGEMPFIYEDTRFPRNPDWEAPPVTPKGSPYPPALRMIDYMQGRARSDARAATSTTSADLMADVGGFNNFELGDYVTCLASAGGYAGVGTGRVQIKMRDRTLPVAFALFDHGRWDEALDEFKVAFRKLPHYHGGDEAALALGKIYLFGLGERSDPVEAVAWLKKAIQGRFDVTRQTPRFYPAEPERNTAMGEAAMLLAQVYASGRGSVAKDPAAAHKYFEKAFYFGHIPAATALGEIYYNGVDRPKDLKKAFTWYRKAAVFQHAPADVAVARMYATGEASGGADPVKAMAWYAQAAKLNHPQALHALAVAFDRGENVAANPAVALNLYKRAAVAGDPAAQAAIGTYFYEGDAGVPHDLAVARRWFERAAIAGDVDGMFNLAVMQAKGEGGGLDRVRAWGWLKIADRLGHANAGGAVRAIEAQFTPEDRAGVIELAARRAG